MFPGGLNLTRSSIPFLAPQRKRSPKKMNAQPAKQSHRLGTQRNNTATYTNNDIATTGQGKRGLIHKKIILAAKKKQKNKQTNEQTNKQTNKHKETILLRTTRTTLRQFWSRGASLVIHKKSNVCSQKKAPPLR